MARTASDALAAFACDLLATARSPETAVLGFYNAVAAGDLQTATSLLGDDLQASRSATVTSDPSTPQSAMRVEEVRTVDDYQPVLARHYRPSGLRQGEHVRPTRRSAAARFPRRLDRHGSAAAPREVHHRWHLAYPEGRRAVAAGGRKSA